MYLFLKYAAILHFTCFTITKIPFSGHELPISLSSFEIVVAVPRGTLLQSCADVSFHICKDKHSTCRTAFPDISRLFALLYLVGTGSKGDNCFLPNGPESKCSQ